MTAPLSRRLRGSLRLVLGAAGVVWIVHFAGVYLASEWICRQHPHGAEPGPALAIIASVATLIAVAAIIALARFATTQTVEDSPSPERRLMTWVLAGIFSFAAVVVGIVPLVLDPC